MQDPDRPRPSELRALAFWLWLGCIGFGGPAGQIAVMHRELVDRKRWLSETRFLRALSFCMVLPGPEAQQLASYSGYTLYGIRGALTAGGLFILPGFLVMTTLSYVYVNHGDTRVVSGIVYVIKNGLHWKDAPTAYGPHKTLYNRFIRWSRLGVFDRIFASLAGEGAKAERIMIDATHLKAHRTAASLLKNGMFPDVSDAPKAD